MKRAMLVLGILMVWVVCSPALHPGTALAGDQEAVTSDTNDSTADVGNGGVVLTFGATDDGGNGDPGDAGDGYGFASDTGGTQGLSNVIDPVWIEVELWLLQLQMDLLP